MPEVLFSLNLYGHQAVLCKVNLLLKMYFFVFSSYVGQPEDHTHRLSKINALHIN